MFTVTTDGAAFGMGISWMKANLPEGFMSFIAASPNTPPDTIYMRALDTANITIAECKMKAAISDGSETLGINYEEFPIDVTGPFTLSVDRADSKISMQYGRLRSKASVIDPTYIKKVGEPHIPWQVIFEINPAEVSKFCLAVARKMDRKNGASGVRFTWTGQEFILEDIERNLIDATFNRDELTIRQDCTTQLETALPLDYVLDSFPMVAKLDTCIIGFGQNMPVTVGGNAFGGLMGAGYMISNRDISNL